MRKGWLAGRAVSAWLLLAACSAGVSAALPPASAWAAPADQATLQIGGLAKVANSGGDAVNVRVQAGLLSNVLGSLEEGTLVLVVGGPELADGFRWWQVQSSSLGPGWMVADYLVAVVNPQGGVVPTIQGPPSAPAATVPARPTTAGAVPTPVVTVLPVGFATPVPTPTAAPTTASGATATPAAAVVPGGAITIGGRVVVQAGSGVEALNIRATASTSAALAGIAPNGAVMTVVDGPVSAEGYKWWLVTWSGVTGWVVDDFVFAAR